MKKLFSLLLLLAVFVSASPARADVLWEPDNRFYESHAESCTYSGRSGIANGEDGYVNLMRAPNGSLVSMQIENGAKLWISWLYEDWAYVSAHGDGEERGGWLPTGQLNMIYDAVSFENDHRDEIQPRENAFHDYSGPSGSIVFWTYPGAPAPLQIWEDSDMPPNALKYLQEGVAAVFVDEEGYRWGFVGYLYGMRNFWVCMDDLTKTDFTVREIPEPVLYPAHPPVRTFGFYLPYLLVAAVVLLTAALLYRFYGKNKKTKAETP